MRVASPRNATSYFKMPSQTNIPDRPAATPKGNQSPFYGFRDQEETVSVYNMMSMGGSNPRLENLFPQQHKATSMRKLNSLAGVIPNKKALLTDTEEKIFGEVIGLVDEIDFLKQSIVSEQQSIQKMQIQNPDVDEKVKFHGYCQPLTAKQCADLEQENNQLLRKIHQIENKKFSGLQEVLKTEKQKYEALKYELTQSTDPEAASKLNQEKIKELREMIAQLESQRKQKVKMHYPGIDRLKNENEELRQKTITNLRIFKMEQDEAIELEEYLKREEHNRNIFLEELKKFKNDYKKLKSQNDALKEKLALKSKRGPSKENSLRKANEHTYNSQSRRSYEESKSRVKTESALAATRGVETRESKLNEYESFLRVMQQTLKK